MEMATRNSQLATRNSQLATKNGFTLVELSIVIVIIGLLIGGILVGQNLIDSAKMHNVIKQLAEYDVAISNFRTKYNQFPGDSNLFTYPGNNNRLIDINPVPNYYEYSHSWIHLSQGIGIKNARGANYQKITPPDFTNEMCPFLKLEKNPSVTYSACLTVTWGWERNFMRYRTWHSIWGVDSFKATDLYAIDQKIDDGLPKTGNIFHTLSSIDDANCVTGVYPNNRYNTADASFRCTALYFMFGSFNGHK